jgi:hypothetical protein
MLAALLLSALTATADGRVLQGVVRDAVGLPLPRASVFVSGSQQMVTTDGQGRFTLEVDIEGAVTIVAFLNGFRPARLEVPPGESKDLELVLDPAPISETLTVVGTRPVENRLRPLDIVRMAGAQADPLQVVQSLPGVVKVDEGSGLFVQGGDTGEVLFLLDGAVVSHPYQYETMTGGLFGSVEPFLLDGLSFATAGFPARYGDALSAVLEMHGLRRPQARQYYLTLGLAGTSGQFAMPVGKKGGLRLSGNRAFTKLLFAVNGEPRHFQKQPESWDLNMSAHYDSEALGSFKLFGNTRGDDVGVEINKEEFTGILDTDARQRSASLRWDKDLGGGWHAGGTAGVDRYTRGLAAGVFQVDLGDLHRTYRLDLTKTAAHYNLHTGIDGIQGVTDIAGQVPSNGGDYGGTRGTKQIFDVSYRDWYTATHAEVETHVGPFTPTVGVRIERFSKLESTKAEPRINVFANISEKQRLRLAWGLYAQAPSPEYYDQATGTHPSHPMEAQHFVAGYERGLDSDPFYLRVEAYHKRYTRLPVERLAGGYDDSGYGISNGADVFLRGRWRTLDFRAAYTYIHARRRWSPTFQQGQYQLPNGEWEPDFSIPHTVELVANYKATSRLTGGVTWRNASGRPFTPITGADKAGDNYTPIYGIINSDRAPLYARLDMSLSYLTPLWKGAQGLIFTGVSNALARQNIFQYKYSPDFSRREPVTSAAPRSFYFGIAIFG